VNRNDTHSVISTEGKAAAGTQQSPALLGKQYIPRCKVDSPGCPQSPRDRGAILTQEREGGTAEKGR